MRPLFFSHPIRPEKTKTGQSQKPASLARYPS